MPDKNEINKKDENVVKINTTSVQTRLGAVQAVYSLIQDKEQNVNDLLAHIKEENIEAAKIKTSHAKKIIEFFVAEEESINFVIKNSIPKHRSFEDINILVLAILSTGIAEIMADEKTDRPIIISEYLEITDMYFGKKEKGFINAILDKFAKGSN